MVSSLSVIFFLKFFFPFPVVFKELDSPTSVTGPTSVLQSSSHLLSRFSCVQLGVTLCTVARQAPLSLGFSWSE